MKSLIRRGVNFIFLKIRSQIIELFGVQFEKRIPSIGKFNSLTTVFVRFRRDELFFL